MTQPTRTSPIQHLLESRGIEFRDFGGGSFAVRVGSEEDDLRTMQRLGLCDVSGLQKLGLKGADAETWLDHKGLDVPSDVFACGGLPDGGVIARVGAEEFFLEDGITNSTLPAFAARIDSHKGRLIRVEHQEATFLLTGRRAIEALAQTCGINFGEVTPRQVVFTRVAGVNCGVMPETIRELPAYRLWVDCSYAVFLWETLEAICESLDGGAVGAGCIYSGLKETI